MAVWQYGLFMTFENQREYAVRNRGGLSLDLKKGRESQFRRSGGRVFHSWGAEQLKALPPIVLRRAGGTERWMEEEDRRERVGILMRRSDR